MRLVEKLRSKEFGREAVSVLALVLCLFAMLALATYDPADLGANSYPSNPIPSNGAGILGAQLATFLFGLFGLSAYLLVGLSVAWSTIYFLRKDVKDVGVKLLGVSLFVVAASILFALRTDTGSFGWSDRTPSYGGLLGDAAAAWLMLRFGASGVYLLVVAIMAVSFLLATDLFFYSLLKEWVARIHEWSPNVFPQRARLVAAPAPAPPGSDTVGLSGSGVTLRIPTWLQRKEDISRPAPASPPFGAAPDAPPAPTPPPTRIAGAPPLTHEAPILDDLGRPVAERATPTAESVARVHHTEQAGADAALAQQLAEAQRQAVAAQEAAAQERRRREDLEARLEEASELAEQEALARRDAEARNDRDAQIEADARRARARARKERLAASKSSSEPADTHQEPETAGDSASERSLTSTAADTEMVLPPVELLAPIPPVDNRGVDNALREKAATLIETLRTFKIECELANIDRGPVITMFELALAPGIKVQRVAGLADNIAMALKAPSVRIVAPIPGKSTVGVEVPNLERLPVKLREIAEHEEFQDHKNGIPVMLGIEATGEPLVGDLTRMPHLLIAGQTGAGKSVCINSLLLSILMSRTPSQVRLLLVDPKQVELGFYADVPHLMLPVVTDMKAAARILDWAVQEMEERYELLSKTGVRALAGFNKLGAEKVRERLRDKGESPEYIQRWAKELPYVVIVIDELADLMMVAAKEVEAQITRLAQKSRAIGIHLILATQRPSVDVITGLIKANVPCRISFQVACKIDSRTILDGPGAEKLLGRGDLLYRAPGSSFLHRAQGAYVDDSEVQAVVEFLAAQNSGHGFDEELTALAEGASDTGSNSALGDPNERDALYNDAVRVILENQRGSVSLLQRKLQIGYTRAAKLIDYMQEGGVVGEPNGSKAREILMTIEEWEARMHGGADEGDFDEDEDEELFGYAMEASLDDDDEEEEGEEGEEGEPDEEDDFLASGEADDLED